MNSALRKSPFACRMVSKASCGPGQGSAMNSLRSALTAVLAGLTDSKMQAKGATESRRCASDILTIELVQNIGLVRMFRIRCIVAWRPQHSGLSAFRRAQRDSPGVPLATRMSARWPPAAFLEGEKSFRKIMDFRDL